MLISLDSKSCTRVLKIRRVDRVYLFRSFRFRVFFYVDRPCNVVDAMDFTKALDRYMYLKIRMKLYFLTIHRALDDTCVKLRVTYVPLGPDAIKATVNRHLFQVQPL